MEIISNSIPSMNFITWFLTSLCISCLQRKMNPVTHGSLRSVVGCFTHHDWWWEEYSGKTEAENLIWIKFFHMISKNEKWFKARESNFHKYFHCAQKTREVLSSVAAILQFNVDFDLTILEVTWEKQCKKAETHGIVPAEVKGSKHFLRAQG